MTLYKCEHCGKPFGRFESGLCGECRKQMDDAYVKVRKYIYENPGSASFASITRHAGVSEKVLNSLIHQGRIVLEGGAAKGETRCRACGGPVVSGVLCERCRKKLIAQKLMPARDERAEEDGRPVRARVQPLSPAPRGTDPRFG